MRIMRRYEDKRVFMVKQIIYLLMLIVILLMPIEANAAMIDEEDMEQQDSPGILEKQFSKFLLNVANSLIGISGAQDVSTLVFQRPEVVNTDTWISNTYSSDREKLVFGIFPESAFNGIAEIYDAFVNLVPIPMVIIFTIGGLILLFDVMRSSERRSSMKEYLLGAIFAILLLRFGYMLWDWIIFINYIVVDTLYFNLIGNGITITSFISTIWDQGSTEEVLSSANFFMAIIVACAAFMTFSINYQYMLRIITLGVLIILFPVVVIFSIIPSRKNVLNQWFSMFTSQVFIQSAHSVALGLFFLLLSADSEGLDFWLCLAMFFGLPMMTDLVQRIVGWIFGDSNASGGIKTSMSNASGLSTALGMVSLGKNLMQSKGTSSNNESKNLATGRVNGGASQDLTGVNVANSSVDGSGNGNGLLTKSGLNGSSPNGPQGNKNGIFGKGKFANAVQSTGKGASSIARKVANSDGLKRNTKLATMGALALGGAAVSTMVTGKTRDGAMAGAALGSFAGAGANFALEKGSRATEVGGEMLQDAASGNDLFSTTKDRIGYHDPSQLSDSGEMARMGRELVGGKSGEILGSIAGKVNHAAGKYDIPSPSTNNFDPKQSYDTVQERQQLIANSIPQASKNVADAKLKLDEAKRSTSIAQSQVQANPKNKVYAERLNSAKKHEAKMNILHETRKTNHEQLVKKAEQFYQRQKLKNELADLGQNRRTSGKL